MWQRGRPTRRLRLQHPYDHISEVERDRCIDRPVRRTGRSACFGVNHQSEMPFGRMAFHDIGGAAAAATAAAAADADSSVDAITTRVQSSNISRMMRMAAV